MFSSGLHILGEAPTQEEMKSYLDAYFEEEEKNLEVEESIRVLLEQSTDELRNLLRG